MATWILLGSELACVVFTPDIMDHENLQQEGEGRV